MYEISKKGIFFERGAPEYGMQDMGISPAGVMDRFAFETGRILLGSEKDITCLEMIFPPVIKFIEKARFTITGAPCTGTVLEKKSGSEEIEHGAVYCASAGDILVIGSRITGFRTYLSLTRQDGQVFPQCARGAWNFTWPDRKGYIRVMEGPEYGMLKNPEHFFTQYWKIGKDSNDMGLRITPSENELEAVQTNMISDAVADGTIQLTPGGPIILLRHRQTMGGYPRIFSCISADVDMLAQYMPGQILRFRKVSFQEAREAADLKKMEIEKLRSERETK